MRHRPLGGPPLLFCLALTTILVLAPDALQFERGAVGGRRDASHGRLDTHSERKQRRAQRRRPERLSRRPGCRRASQIFQRSNERVGGGTVDAQRPYEGRYEPFMTIRCGVAKRARQLGSMLV